LNVGKPVAFAIERLAIETPNTRFHENENHGTIFIKILRETSILSFMEGLESCRDL
jgi:hypothetical protein